MDKLIYAEIENQGEIDINAFRLIGATTKNESQIGYFGSGIKYALATALRTGVPIEVFSGSKKIEITTQKTEMRGQEFDVVCIDGVPTSITTQMGRDWKPWFIFREFYCNALDEGEAKLEVTEEVEGVEGKTRVYIGLVDEMKDVFANRDKYFAQRRLADYEAGGIKIYRPLLGESMIIYRKGIQVANREGQPIYDYDFTRLAINEAREASDWDITYEMVGFWCKHASQEMISALLNTEDVEKTLEFQMNWSTNSGANMGLAWNEILKDKIVIPYEHGGKFTDDLTTDNWVMLPWRLCQRLKLAFKDLKIRGFETAAEDLVEVPFRDREEKLVEEAVDFLKKSNQFDQIGKYPIKKAVLGKAVLGQVIGDTIYLSEKVFSEGRRTIVETLIEEYVHIHEEVYDRTRGMQDNLIKIIVNQMEEKEGINL